MNILNLYECMKNGKFYFTNILNECALFNCLEVLEYVSTDDAAVGDEKKCKQFAGVTLVVFYCLTAYDLWHGKKHQGFLVQGILFWGN